MENVSLVVNPSEDKLISKLDKPLSGFKLIFSGSPANTYLISCCGVAQTESAGFIKSPGRLL